MKSKFLTIISLIMLFVPWSIFPLRSFDWALQSPAAEIIITCYALFMIASGAFTIYAYMKAGIQNHLMKLCLLVNSLYGAAGIVILGMLLHTKLM